MSTRSGELQSDILASSREGAVSCEAAGKTDEAIALRDTAKVAEQRRSSVIAAIASAKAADADPVKRLPPNPSPPSASMAGDKIHVESEQSLRSPVFAALWDPKRKNDQSRFLSMVSDGLSVDKSGAGSQTLPAVQWARSKNLMDFVMSLIAIHIRTGRYPSEFVSYANTFLASVATEPHLGVWTKGSGGRDVSALASFLHPGDAAYLREFIAARKEFGWPPTKDPYLRHFAREKTALERLAILTTLSPSEDARLQELK